MAFNFYHKFYHPPHPPSTPHTAEELALCVQRLKQDPDIRINYWSFLVYESDQWDGME